MIKFLFKTIIYLFAFIGLALVLLVFYIYYKNPFGISDIFFKNSAVFKTTESVVNTAETILDEVKNESQSINNVKNEDVINNFDITLTSEQEKLLKTLGIDPERLNDPEVQACALEKIGEEKLKKISTGEETPGLTDILLFKSCL